MHSWTEAIETFSREDVDLVLMDAVMPTVDGFKLTAMLRIRRLTHALEVRTRRLAQLASIDNLTGLLNRRSLEERLSC